MTVSSTGSADGNTAEREKPERQRILGGLNPADALAEVICGLVMTLTIILTAGHYAVSAANPSRILLKAALGCTLAWGIIDGMLYVMSDLYKRARRNQLLTKLRSNPAGARTALQEKVRDSVGEVTDAELTALVDALARIGTRQEIQPVKFTSANFRAMTTSIVCNIAALIPAALPFLVLRGAEWRTALRASNGMVVAMMFGVGYAWAKSSGFRPLRTGLILVAIGLAMVGVAVLLGG